MEWGASQIARIRLAGRALGLMFLLWTRVRFPTVRR
jgi:hypothetical protein